MGHQIDFLSRDLEGRWIDIWGNIKLFSIDIGIDSCFHLTITPVECPRPLNQCTISTMGMAINFDKTGSIRCHDHFAMGWTIPYAHGVKYATDVGDQNSGL